MKKRKAITPAGPDGSTLAMKAAILGSTKFKDMKFSNIDTLEQNIRRLTNRYGKAEAKKLVDTARETLKLIDNM